MAIKVVVATIMEVVAATGEAMATTVYMLCSFFFSHSFQLNCSTRLLSYYKVHGVNFFLKRVE